MLNNEIFMAATIIHSLQGFHIHYGMYMMEKRLEILLFFFYYYFIGFLSTLRRLRGGDFKGENSSN